MKINSLALAFGLVAFASNLLAQDSAMNDLGHDLDRKRTEMEASLRPILDEQTHIEEQQAQLQKRLKEIEVERANALKKVEQNLGGKALRDFLVKNSPLGKCKLTPGTDGHELLIEQNWTKIRFLFDPTRPLVARLLGTDNRGLIEVQQDEFTPQDSSGKTAFKAILRFESGTDKIIHAVFTGERIEDGLLGWSSSRKPTIVTCLLE